MLPFTRDQFFQIFTNYNAAVWPASLAAYVLAALAIAAVFRWPSSAPRLVSATLALMWVWTGLAYHLAFFSRISGAAYGFAALFLVGAAVIAWQGVVKNRLRPVPWTGWRSGLGWALIAYAMIIYPLIGLASGHAYGDLPQFGVAPCPVTLFTFGMLLLMPKPVPKSVLAAPVIWSLIGGQAAFLLGVPQDWPLLVSGIATIAALYFSKTYSNLRSIDRR